ncbi:uncharacterized protein [Apostichopus japonicus]|uniref:uncharacterized protein isoform X2 n=1 Tax=Stichopus japonicus TaxID=307972 RepID=UPI003AB912E3
MTVLSPLARGKGSWEGDLESTPSKRVFKPVLKHYLDEEKDFLDKSVANPIRVKSRLGHINSIVQEVSKIKTKTSQDVPPATFAKYLHSKAPSTELSRPKTSKSQRRYPSKPSQILYNPTRHIRVKSAPMRCHADLDGQLNLPKTYLTRKGALMLFASPENLAFSHENDERCYFYDPDDVDTAQLALQEMQTLDNLTTSVLQYGNQQQQQIFSKLASAGRLGKTGITYAPYNKEEAVDFRTQPGGDFFFYLRDVQAKASYRNLVRSPSYHSLNSEEATEDLTSALRTLDDEFTESRSMIGESTLCDFSTVGESTRDWLKSSVSGHRVSQVTCATPASASGDAASMDYRANRPNTGRSFRSSSIARTTTPLSFKEIAMSIKSAPYLGRPLSAAYPSTYSAYIPAPPAVEHDTHPSEEEEEEEGADNQSQNGRRPSSRYSTRSQKSTSSQGAKSTRSEKSGLSRRSVRGVSPGDQQLILEENQEEAPEEHQGRHAVSRSSRRSGSHRSGSWQSDEGIIQEGDGRKSEARNGSERSRAAPMSAGSKRSQVSWADEKPQQLEEGADDDDVEEEEDDDWRSEVIEIAISERGEPMTELQLDEEVKDEVNDEDEVAMPMEETDKTEGKLETNNERKTTSRVSSASSRRMYTPRTRSSGRTTPIEMDEGEELPDERIPSSAASVKRSISQMSQSPPEEAAYIPGEVHEDPSRVDEEVDDINETHEKGSAFEGETEQQQIVHDESDAKLVDVEILERGKTPQDAEGPPEQPVEEEAPPKPRTMLLEDASVIPNQQTVVKQDLPSTRKPEADVPSKGKSQPTQTTIKKVVTVVTMPEKKLAPKEDPVPIVPPQKAEKPKVTSVVSASLASVKAKNAGKKSPRSGRKHKGGGGKKTTFSGPQLDFVGSMVIDPYAGPSQDEMDDMVAEELAKELAAQNLEEDKPEEKKKPEEEEQDDVDSLATDDEAIEKELKKTRVPSQKKESKKKLAKERAAIKEARRLEKQRREDEMKALREKKRLMEEERKRLEMEEIRRKEELADRIAEAEQEAEMARQAEEDAKLMMQEVRKTAREEREAKRRADAERRKTERERQREERKKMEDQARQREEEMAEKLASAEERRKMQEESRLQREEQERLEQEERDRLEEEELMRLEEEEEKIRELEREAEREAMERLITEREAAESNRRQAEKLRKQQEAKEERRRQEELERKAKEEERLLMLKIEEEQKREKELERIRQIQRLEEEARFKVRKELERRRARALRRREQNLEQQGHMNGLRRTQGMTKPWVFTYYVHWPRDTYERRLPSGDKKKKRGAMRKSRAKTAPPVMVEAKSNMSDSAAGP